jgi:hypothetical protein
MPAERVVDVPDVTASNSSRPPIRTESLIFNKSCRGDITGEPNGHTKAAASPARLSRTRVATFQWLASTNDLMEPKAITQLVSEVRHGSAEARDELVSRHHREVAAVAAAK